RNALAQSKEPAMAAHTSYRTVKVDGLSIFYRKAGPKDAPTILLLHGFPSSVRVFEPLFARLSDRYHLVAPDYPGFGHSDWPDPKQFDYTFDHIGSVGDKFTQALALSHYTLYMQDYGGPVGFRMALAHPERVQALIAKNAVAHNEGLGPIWATRRAFWADRPAHEAALRDNLLSLAATKTRHIGDDPKSELYDPDLWTDEHAYLSAPGQAQIQSNLFYDYRTNVAAYPRWQAWLQNTQPKLLGAAKDLFEPILPSGRDGVIPLAVELGRRQPDRRQLRVRDLHAGRVAIGVQRRLHHQPGLCRGVGDQGHDGLPARQRPTPPVVADVAEQPVLLLVPPARPRREVAHRHPQPRLARPPLQRHLPQAVPRAVAAPAVRRHQHLAGAGEQRRPHPPPPAPQRLDREAAGVVVDADADPAPVAQQVIDPLPDGPAQAPGPEGRDAGPLA